jgi:hypothetical protein
MINLPPIAGGFIPHLPFSGPRPPFLVREDNQTSLHNTGARFPSRPLFFSFANPSMGVATLSLVEEAVGTGAMPPGVPTPSEVSQARPGGPSFSRAGRRDSGGVESGVSPAGNTGLSRGPGDRGQPSGPGGVSAAAKLPVPRCFTRALLTVCVSVCERVGSGRARAKAGVGPRRSVRRQRLHRHAPGQPICAETICLGDPDAGVD